MKGKLSWMTFSIIGGAIVSAVIILVYFILVKGFIVSQYITQSTKPWSELILSVDSAATSGSYVIDNYIVGYHPSCGVSYFGCNSHKVPQCPNDDEIPAIFILTDEEVHTFETWNLPRSSLAQLSKCASPSGKLFPYCYCAVVIDLEKSNYCVKRVESYSGCDDGYSTVFYTKPSIVTDVNLPTCVPSDIKFIACEGEQYPLYYNGHKIKIIQYFYSKSVFINAHNRKDNNGNYVLTGFDFGFVEGDCSWGNCINVTNTCPYKYGRDC